MSANRTPDRFNWRIARSMAGLNCLGPWIDRVSAALRLAPPAEYALRLCVEEVVANVIMHGGPSAPGAATVHIALEAGDVSLTVTVEDGGAAFDPTTGEVPSPLPDRPGGRGILLMRRYASAVNYGRVDGLNRLTLTIARTDTAEHSG